MCIILNTLSCVILWKRKKKKYIINRNPLFVGDYDYIIFLYDFTRIILCSDYDKITKYLKIYDNDYFTIISLIKFMITIMVTITVHLYSVNRLQISD